MMGVCDIIGTTLSGWLSDRYDNRVLLCAYYGLRGLSLLYLPYSDFDILWPGNFYRFLWPGLDRDRAAHGTPDDGTLRRRAGAADLWLDRRRAPARRRHRGVGAGVLRVQTNRYFEAFVIAGMACLVAAMMSLLIRSRPSPARLQPAPVSSTVFST